MKYKNIQTGISIKDDFFLYLDNNEFDKITNEMKEIVNEIFIIRQKNHYLLLYFINKNKENVIIWLLNLFNIDVNIQNLKGYTPLNLACILNYNNIVELLLNHLNINVNLQNINSDTSLHIAINENSIDCINLLLNNLNINVNLQNITGNTPLHIAINNININNIKLLLDHHNININLQNINGDTPLHLSMYINNITGISDILLQYINIEVNIQNNDGNTPLHIAIIYNNNDIIKELIYKTDLTIINKLNNSILSLYCDIINNNSILYNKEEIIILILNKYINYNYNISAYDYLNITCWSIIDNTTLSIFNDFITKYHNKFPDLKIRSDKALEYYNIFTNNNNNKQFMINAHGKTLNNYFIIPSNMMIIMQTPINDLAYNKRYNIKNPNIILPPCYINKNYDEYIKSILKINPYVYISGSLMKNNHISFYEHNKTKFKKFYGILNIEQITKEDFKLPQLNIDFIDNWTNLNKEEKNDFILKYTDIDIFPIDIIKQNNFNLFLSDIVKKINDLYPTNYIILYITVCRECNESFDFYDICPNIVEQTTILKNPKRRGSFSLSSTNIENIDNLLLSNHNNFQKIFDIVKNNSNNDNIQNIIVEYYRIYNLSNNNICDILSEYLKIKNI